MKYHQQWKTAEFKGNEGVMPMRRDMKSLEEVKGLQLPIEGKSTFSSVLILESIHTGAGDAAFFS